MPSVISLMNGVFVLVVLRLLLPRMLAVETMQDLYEFAPELGLPGREELLGYVEYAAEMSYFTKAFLFFVVLTLEKLTLVGEFLPIGVVLPAISPVLFGGVLEGTVISAGLAALASTINFWIARTFLREKALKLELFDQVSADYPFFS